MNDQYIPFYDCPEDPCKAETMMQILGMPDRKRIKDVREFCDSPLDVDINKVKDKNKNYYKNNDKHKHKDDEYIDL